MTTNHDWILTWYCSAVVAFPVASWCSFVNLFKHKLNSSVIFFCWSSLQAGFLRDRASTATVKNKAMQISNTCLSPLGTILSSLWFCTTTTEHTKITTFSSSGLLGLSFDVLVFLFCSKCHNLKGIRMSMLEIEFLTATLLLLSLNNSKCQCTSSGISFENARLTE